MPEQEFALDAAGNYVQIYVLDEPDGGWVGINRSFIGGIPSREALRAGQEFALQDGSTLRVQLVENQLQVFRDGQRLSPNPYGVPPQQPYYQPQAYYEYAAPPQAPYGAFPYQQPGYGTPPVQAARLPLGEAIRQLPGQYIRVLTRPSTAFAEEMGKGSWGIVWIQLIGLVVIQAVSSFITSLIRSSMSPNPQDQAFVLGYVLGQFLGSMMSVLVFFFIWMGILYGLARAFGGQGTFRAQGYTSLLFYLPLSMISTVLALLLIPARVFDPVIVLFIAFLVVIIAFALLVYEIVLQIFAIMAVHRLSGGKATAVILISLAVILFIVILFIIILIVITVVAARRA